MGGLPGPVCGRRTATRDGPYAEKVGTVSAVAGRCWRLGGLPGPVCGRRTATRGGPYEAMAWTVSAVAGRYWRLGGGRPLLAPTHWDVVAIR